MIPSANSDLIDVLDDVFADRAGIDVWDDAAMIGLPWVGIAEEHGGVGGTTSDTVAVAHALGRHGIASPVVETLLASFAVAASGRSIEQQQMAFALADDANHLSLRSVPWGRDDIPIVVVSLSSDRAYLLDAQECRMTTGVDLAGQPCVDVEAQGAELLAEGSIAAATVQHHGLLRAAQATGAIRRASEMTKAYAKVREQFGRPIATFQAVVQHLVALEQAAVVCETALAQVARLVDEHGMDAVGYEIDALVLVVGRHGALAAAAAHQAHGAIGMTEEYPLANTTRLLNTWRGDLIRHGHVAATRVGARARSGVATLVAHEITD